MTTNNNNNNICFIKNICRNKYLFKILLRELRISVYKEINRLDWYINHDKIEILKEKVELNHYLSFETTNLQHLFNCKSLKEDDEFYSLFFKNYDPIHKDQYNSNSNIGENNFLEIGQSLLSKAISADCIGATKILLVQYQTTIINAILSSIHFGSFKVFKYLLECNKSTGILDNISNINSVWNKIIESSNSKSMNKFIQLLINEYELQVPDGINIQTAIISLFGKCPFKENVNTKKFTLLNLIHSCKTILLLNLQKQQLYSTSFFLTNNEIDEILNSKSKLELQSTITSFSNNDQSMYKLLKMYLSINKQQTFIKNIYIWLKYNYNDKSMLNYFLFTPDIGILSLEYGNYDLLSKWLSLTTPTIGNTTIEKPKFTIKSIEIAASNLFSYTRMQRIHNMNNGNNCNGSTGSNNGNSNFKYPKLLFKHCQDTQLQLQFIKNGNNLLNQIFMIVLLVNYNDLSLVQFAVTKLNETDLSGISIDQINSMIRNIQSVEMLDYIFNNFIKNYKHSTTNKPISVQPWIDLSRIDLLKHYEQLIMDKSQPVLNIGNINSLTLEYIMVEKQGNSKYQLDEFDQINFSPKSTIELNRIISILSSGSSNFKYHLFRPYKVPLNNNTVCNQGNEFYSNYSPYRIQLFKWISKNRNQDLQTGGRLVIDNLELYELLYLIGELNSITLQTQPLQQSDLDYVFQRIGEQGDIKSLMELLGNEQPLSISFKSSLDTGFIRLLFGSIEYNRIEIIEYLNLVYPEIMSTIDHKADILNLNKLEVYNSNYYYDFNKRCDFDNTDTILVTNKEFKLQFNSIQSLKEKQEKEFKTKSERIELKSSWEGNHVNVNSLSTSIKLICTKNNHLNLYFNYYEKN